MQFPRGGYTLITFIRVCAGSVFRSFREGVSRAGFPRPWRGLSRLIGPRSAVADNQQVREIGGCVARIRALGVHDQQCVAAGRSNRAHDGARRGPFHMHGPFHPCFDSSTVRNKPKLTIGLCHALIRGRVYKPVDHGLDTAGRYSTTSRGTMMLSESLVALAAAGGTAVVQAVGTDAWGAVRDRTARLFAGSNAERHTAELARLEETARDLSDETHPDTVLVRWESSWRARWEMLLDSLPDTELPAAADELSQVISLADRRAGATSISACDHGMAVGGDVSITAESGSLAGGVVTVEGGISLAGPFEGRSRPQ